MIRKLIHTVSVFAFAASISTAIANANELSDQLIDKWASDEGLLYDFSSDGSFTIVTQTKTPQTITGKWSLSNEQDNSIVLSLHGNAENQKATIVFQGAHVMEIHGTSGFPAFSSINVFDERTNFIRFETLIPINRS